MSKKKHLKSGLIQPTKKCISKKMNDDDLSIITMQSSITQSEYTSNQNSGFAEDMQNKKSKGIDFLDGVYTTKPKIVQNNFAKSDSLNNLNSKMENDLSIPDSQYDRDFSFEIMNKIQNVQPKTRLYAKFRLILLISAIILIGVVCVIALAIFGYDLQEKISIFEFAGNPIMEIIFSFLFELLLMVPVGLFLIYFIYRHTDWKFAKERMGILLISSMSIIVFSCGLVSYLKTVEDNNPVRLQFSNFRQRLRNPSRINPPHIKDPIEKGGKNLPPKLDYYYGTIIKIENDQIYIQQANDSNSQVFTLVNKIPLKVSQKVVVGYDNQNGTLVIKRIKEIR